MVPRPETNFLLAGESPHDACGEGSEAGKDYLLFRRRNRRSRGEDRSVPPSSSVVGKPGSSSHGLGRLRFGRTHGILGMVSVPCVMAALCSVRAAGRPSPWAVVPAILATAALGASGIPLLRQVPRCTVISRRWNIVPPHKEAFRRTIAIVGYLDLRLSSELLLEGSREQGPRFWFSVVLGLYYLCFFVPRGSFDNGNTWVFVVPMFLGFGADLFHQLPPAEPSAPRGVSWNDDVVTTEYLLWTLLATQVVAFLFTLGFRNIVPIRYGYWIAALVVLSLCAGMGLNYRRAAAHQTHAAHR